VPFGFQFRSILRGGEAARVFHSQLSLASGVFPVTLLAVAAGSAVPFVTSRLPVAGICIVLLAIAISAFASKPLRELIARLEDSNRRFDRACIEFVETMAQALEARDPYTAGHSNRVRDYSVAIARAMRLPPEEVEIIRVGAQLHDIGKIGIPDAVLQKTAYLTPDEYELV